MGEIVIDICSIDKKRADLDLPMHKCRMDAIQKAIKNGVELPEGHGRLIDADALRNTYTRAELVGYDEEIKAINEAPTILEADMKGLKGSSL